MELQYSLPDITSTLQIIGCHMGSFPPGWSFPRHHHNLFELLYCKSGQIRQTVGKQSFAFRAGDWLLIKSGIVHASDNSSEEHYGFFNLHFDLDDPIIRERLCREDYVMITKEEAAERALPVHFKAIEHALLQFSRNYVDHADKAMNRLVIQAHTLGTITEFMRYWEQAMPLAESGNRGPNLATVSETEQAHAIEDQLRNAAHSSINEIAASLGMSRGRCTSIFSKVYGQSPRQYRSSLVLNQAKHLLVHSTHTMEELAEQLGFQSASHFSRQFRRWTGMPPSAFRPKFMTSQQKEVE